MKTLFMFYSAILILIFPRQLTNLICYGRHRNELRVKTVSGYIANYAIWTIVFTVLCMIMGTACGIKTPFDKVMNFIMLTATDKEYICYESYDTDELYVYTYHTQKSIDENTLLEIAYSDKVFCDAFQLHDLTIRNLSGSIWLMELNKEKIAYIKTKKGIFLNELRYEWNRQIMDIRRKPKEKIYA